MASGGADPISGILGFVSDLIGSRGSSRTDTGTTTDQKTVTSGDTFTSMFQNMLEESGTTTKSVKGTTGTSKTTTDNLVQNTTDAGVVGFMKSLMTQAATNANDPSKTDGVVAGITNTLRDAMTTSFGRQNQAGLYGSSSAALINNDLTARASADAAQAVLGYQTNQQRLAFDTASDLGKMLSKQITRGSSVTNSAQVSDELSNTAATDRKVLNSEQNQRSQQTSQVKGYTASGQNTRSSSGMISVVCTWMFQNGKMSIGKYTLSSSNFSNKPLYQQKAYSLIGRPLVSWLEKTEGKGILSAIILELFRSRTQYVCATLGYRKSKKTLWGWICRALIASVCFFPAIYYLFRKSYSQELLSSNQEII